MNPILIGGVVLAGVFSVFGFSAADQKQTLISPVVSVTPTITLTPPASVSAIVTTPIPTASPTATSTIKKQVTPKPKPTPTAEPKENVSRLVDKYSSEYGLDVNVVRYLVLCESGLRSNATNGKYVGLFQYDERTWKTIRTEMKLDVDVELRYSAEEAVKTTTYALSKGKTKLWPNCVP